MARSRRRWWTLPALIATAALIAGIAIVALPGDPRSDPSARKTPVAKSAPARADLSPTVLFVAPANECSDANDGTAPTRPLCSLRRASEVLDAKYRGGRARGDVWIRFRTGASSDSKERIYSPRLNQSARERTFTFAAGPGATVHFVPDWLPGPGATETGGGKRHAVFRGIQPQPGTRLGQENEFGLLVNPAVNRGGTYHFSHLRFERFLSGLMLLGNLAYNDPQGMPINEGVIAGKTAPINAPVFEHLEFSAIGSSYSSGYYGQSKDVAIESKGNAALRFINTTNARVENNLFSSVNNANKATTHIGHVIYGASSSKALVARNTFENSNVTVVHSRQSAAWTITDNQFKNTTREEVSTWFAYGDRTKENGRYAECEATYPQHARNTVTEQGAPVPLSEKHVGSKGKPEHREENPFCNAPSRVYPPSTLAARQTDSNTYSLTWGSAPTNGDPVRHYEVSVQTPAGDTHVLTRTSEKAAVISRQHLTQLGMEPEKEFVVRVVAVGKSGGRSSRRALDLAVTFIEPYAGLPPATVYSADLPARKH